MTCETNYVTLFIFILPLVSVKADKKDFKCQTWAK